VDLAALAAAIDTARSSGDLAVVYDELAVQGFRRPSRSSGGWADHAKLRRRASPMSAGSGPRGRLAVGQAARCQAGLAARGRVRVAAQKGGEVAGQQSLDPVEAFDAGDGEHFAVQLGGGGVGRGLFPRISERKTRERPATCR
jgi:hypothetical protein